MSEDAEDGFDTPEEAARGDIDAQFVSVLGVRVEGDVATVWMLTNDGPPFEPYTVQCRREDGRWFGGNGSNVLGPPLDVVIAAAKLGWW
jgi:hypothetical protein